MIFILYILIGFLVVTSSYRRDPEILSRFRDTEASLILVIIMLFWPVIPVLTSLTHLGSLMVDLGRRRQNEGVRLEKREGVHECRSCNSRNTYVERDSRHTELLGCNDCGHECEISQADAICELLERIRRK